MAIEIVDFPIENGGSFHSYVSVHQSVNLLSFLGNLSTNGPNGGWFKSGRGCIAD